MAHPVNYDVWVNRFLDSKGVEDIVVARATEARQLKDAFDAKREGLTVRADDQPRARGGTVISMYRRRC